MAYKTTAIVLAGGNKDELPPLTRDRCKAAIPFGGKYRIIDFVLSNCINSNIRQINVMVQYKSDSLHKHIRDGWSFLNPTVGEYVDVYPPQQIEGDKWYSGTADAVYQNLYTIEEETPEYVLVLAGDQIYHMDYQPLLNYHVQTGADLTVVAVPVPVNECPRHGIIEVDRFRKVVDFHEHTSEDHEKYKDNEYYLSSIGAYLFTTKVLQEIVLEDSKRKSSHDFERDIIPSMVDSHKIMTFFYTKEDGSPRYWTDLRDIDVYYHAHQDMLHPPPNYDIFQRQWKIKTFEKQSALSMIQAFHPRFGLVINSLISGGGMIAGTVKNSILSYNVTVQEDAEIKNSIIFEDVKVGKGAKIKNAIIEKHVNIPDGFQLGYDIDQDRSMFKITENGIVVIAKKTMIYA